MPMTPTRLLGTATVVVLATVALVSASPQTNQELRDRAADLVYNLDHDAAIGVLRQAIASTPDDPSNHRALASAIWLKILFLRGAVTVDHYLGSFSNPTVNLRNPPADLDAEFKREVTRAIELAEQRVAVTPKDWRAQFD